MGRRREAGCVDIYNLVIAAFMMRCSPWLFALARKTARADAWLSGIAIVLLSSAAIVLFAEWEEWIRPGLRRLDRGVAVAARFPAHGRDARVRRHWNCGDVYWQRSSFWLIHYDSPAARPSA